MHRIRYVLAPILLALAPGATARAQSAYIDSRGARVELTPAQDRIAVALSPNRSVLRALAKHNDILWTSARRQGRALWEIPLAPHAWGRGVHVAAHLVEQGLATRAGMVFVEAGSERHFFLDRGVIVKFHHPAAVAADLLRPVGLVPVRALGHAGDTFLCRADDARTALRGAVHAAGMPGVRWALPDFILVPTLHLVPDDPFYGEQWHHHQASDAHLHSQQAWDVTTGDRGVVVAVIDTGLEETHPDFAPDQIVTGYNVPEDSDDPTPLGDAINYHGTACSGEIGATIDNTEGVAGVCPGCSLMGVLMFNEGTGASISDGYIAIQVAVDRGAWVLSCSWGVAHTGIDMQPYYDAVDFAVTDGRGGLGSVVLFASGNGDMWGNAEPIASNALANLPTVMAVGGTDHQDDVVSYSNYGPNLSVVAPTGGAGGEHDQIVTTDTLGDRGCSRQGTHWQTGMWGGEIDTGLPEPDSTGNYTRYFNGTSAACPLAAGVVGLVFSVDPGLTGAQARLIVEQSADKVGNVTYDADGHNIHYGYGRVNAARAARAAAIGFDQPPGAVCAEDLNCALGGCEKLDPEDPYGNCTIVDCTGQPDGTVCVDDDACTHQTSCQAGACVGVPVDCDDDNPCTDDACDPGTGCVYQDNQAPCNDGSLCTTGDTCSGGRCSGDPVDCDDQDACTVDSCRPQDGCRHEPLDCDDGNPCTDDGCDPATGCTHPPLDCDDQDACTVDSCLPLDGCRHAPLDCDDQDACTTDTCEPDTGCVHAAIDCDDADPCTTDTCDPQQGCIHGADPGTCDDGNPCTDDSCEPGSGCRHEPNQASCNDGDPCTRSDTCRDGICDGEPRDCSRLDGTCMKGTCNPQTGSCEAIPRQDGTACDDENPCTTGDACTAGDCTGTPRDCPASGPCRTGACDPQTGDCLERNQADGTACSSGDACLEDETCLHGVCQGGTRVCDEESSGCGCGHGQDPPPWSIAVLLLLAGALRAGRHA